jgi:RNA polymerase sigma factor (sigma-70 family)
VKADDERRYVEYVSSRLTWLRKVAFLLCQDWHRADDIAQAAITKLYVHWRKAGTADNLDACARRVLLREFLGARRTAWASRVDLTAAPLDNRPPADSDPTMRIAVRSALVDVPPRQRAALVLRYYCDLSVAETADLLGCSTGTEEPDLAGGLGSLRRALDARRSRLRDDMERSTVHTLLHERAESPAPPSTVDISRAAAAGRHTVRLRRILGGGSAAMAVVAVVGAVVIISGGAGVVSTPAPLGSGSATPSPATHPVPERRRPRSTRWCAMPSSAGCPTACPIGP